MTDPQPEFLHRGFELRAAEDGDRGALTDGGRTLSYGELNQAANRLAHHLRERGARPGSLVGVMAGRGADFVIALLAVLKTGSGYVPLDPDYPTSRLHHIIDDCALSLVVGDPRYGSSVAAPGTEFVDMGRASVADAPTHDLDVTPDPRDTMYVIHTSGSTGPPKGVVITHANAVRLFEQTREPLGITADDVWSAFHSFAFDFSVWEIWGALLHGGRLVIVPYRTARDPEAFWRLLTGERVTVLNQTPSAFQYLMAHARRVAFPPTSLRLVVFGGEELRPARLLPWFDAYGDVSPLMVNMYGITETTVHVTLRPLTAVDADRPGSPMGVALPDLRLHVLDDRLAPVPPGEIGELHVAGAGLADGYLGRPALTAERFVPDPHGPVPGGRLYRTGDLAEMTPDGELMFRGRADRQVQLRGFRIEPGEVEVALLALPGIAEAAVVVREDEDGERALVAYVVEGVERASEPAAVRAALALRLPRHLLPAAVVGVKVLPTTHQGKLDMSALPDPWSEKPETASPLSSPATAVAPAADGTPPFSLAETIAAVWADVLGLPRVGPDDDFFALGGDSIRATRVVARAREHGVEFGVAQLYETPTVRQMARSTGSSGPAPERAGSGGAGAGPGGAGTDVHPVSGTQAGIIYDCEVDTDPTLYRVLAAVRLTGPLVPDAWRRALALLASHHEVLRGSFDLDAIGGPVQRIRPHVRIPLSVAEVAPLPADPDENVRRAWREEWVYEIDTTTAPPLLARLLPYADGSYHLALVVHHALLDGWSFALLCAELLAAYRADIRDEPQPRSPAHAWDDTWGHLERERSAASDPLSEKFWRARLHGLDPGPLPAPVADDGPGRLTAGEPVTALLAPDTFETLRRTAHDLSVPVRSLFMAAQLWSSAALTGHRTPVVGLVSHVRPENSAGDRVMGMFLNLFPVTAELTDDLGWPDLVRLVFEQERAVMPHRRVPLSRLTSWHGGPLFHTVLTYTDFRVLDRRNRGPVRECGDWLFVNHTSFPLYTEIQRAPSADHATLTTRAHPARTSPLTATRTVTLMTRALASLATTPDHRLPPLPDPDAMSLKETS
ncbi:non-ribosomal peptide synthetase [Streptomyces sp. DT24]|uniref:non-ribosomal peptide synthetase n=1 Tax=Streptomyces sp. DT24 TaxID=3416520 RepID=UPI003CEA3F7E